MPFLINGHVAVVQTNMDKIKWSNTAVDVVVDCLKKAKL